MIKNIAFGAFLLVSGFFSAQNTAMSGAEAKAFVAKVSSDTREIKTLQSDFTQTKKWTFWIRVLLPTEKCHYRRLIC